MSVTYDVITVGGGIAGLVGAARMAQKGKRVLVIEKEPTVGGYFAGFTTPQGDKIDYAVSYVLSCGKDDVVGRFLKDLGLTETAPFKKLAHTDRAVFPDITIQFGSGKEKFEQKLLEKFPDDADDIHRFCDWLSLFQEGTQSMGKSAGAFFIKYYQKTFQDFLNDTIKNERLRGLLSLRIQAYPSSLMIMAGFMVECYFKGMYYPVGGAQKFSDTLADYIRGHGGEVLTDTEIVCFKNEGKHIEAVIDTQGTEYRANSFIFNGDVIRLYDDYAKNPEALQRASKREIGHSSLNIYLVTEGLDLQEFDSCGRIYLSDTYDVSSAYEELESGHFPQDPVIKIHIPTRHDRSLAAEGREIIRIETDICWTPEMHASQQDYFDFAQKMMCRVEDRLIPGLAEHTRFSKIITPIDFHKMFLHANGSGTGWAHTVHNSMGSPYRQTTPFDNLFLAGQWGEFSSGLRQIVLSGEKAAELIERKKKQ